MQRDKVLGLSLAILLIGFAGAFCFRNETGSIFSGPQLRNPRVLDDAIANKEGPKPYTGDPGAAKPEATPTGVTLEGIEPDTPFASSTPDEPVIRPFTNENTQRRDSWGTPDYLKQQNGQPRHNPRPQGRQTPVSVQKESGRGDIWIPKHNQAWETDASDGEMNTADQVPRNEGLRTYRVQPGDTLTGIAARYLGTSSRYLEIYDANRDMLRTPNDLRSGMVLRIPAQSRSAQNSHDDVIGPEAHNEGYRNISPRHSRTSSPASNRSIDSNPVSYVQQRPKLSQPTDSLGLPAKRFIPVTRSPFAPRAVNGDPNPAKPRPLSQVPPGDLPDMRMQYFPKEKPADERSEMQIIPMKKPSASAQSTARLHLVKRGETLESIALRTYGSRSKSHKIFEANRDRLRTANGLREGMTIVLP